MKSVSYFGMLACLGLLGVAGGCRSRGAGDELMQGTKYSIEGTEKFSVSDRPQRIYVACTGLQEKVTSDGRLEVIVNIQNRENRRLALQVRCVFKDARGFSTGDETAWQPLELDEAETQAVRYTAANAAAKKFTVVVRAAQP